MELKIESMTCGGCARSVAKAIQSLDPNAKIEANPDMRLVTVQSTASEDVILQVLAKAGYPAVTS